MIQGINHVTVVVKNKKEAERFYCEILGLEKVEVGQSLWVRIGEQFIHVNENKDLDVQKTFHHFCIEIESLAAYLRVLIDQGVEVFDLDDELIKMDINSNLDKERRSYFIYDPFGNLLEFIDSKNQFFKP